MKRSSYRLNGRLNASRRSRLAYISYLQSDPATRTGGGDGPEPTNTMLLAQESGSGDFVGYSSFDDNPFGELQGPNPLPSNPMLALMKLPGGGDYGVFDGDARDVLLSSVITLGENEAKPALADTLTYNAVNDRTQVVFTTDQLEIVADTLYPVAVTQLATVPLSMTMGLGGVASLNIQTPQKRIGFLMALAGALTLGVTIPPRPPKELELIMGLGGTMVANAEIIPPGLTIARLLMVAGGGAGGGTHSNNTSCGGGGGAGGVIEESTPFVLPVGAYPIVVGAGGTAPAYNVSNKGADTTFASRTALGGGKGGGAPGAANSGGSGGGGSGGAGAAGTAGQGNAGGNGNGGVEGVGGSGGGFGAAGTTGGAATTGKTTNIRTGSNQSYASGGQGGGIANAAGAGAAANTGNGGGGANVWGVNQFAGGAGGSGIVVIRYAGAPKATGGTITTVGTDTVHTFTASGTFTVLDPNARLIDRMMLVGGGGAGGGGGGGGNSTVFAGGAGAGGEVVQLSAIYVAAGTYSIVVGEGGINANATAISTSGDETTALGYTAKGGGNGGSLASTPGPGGGGRGSSGAGPGGNQNGANSNFGSLFKGGNGGGSQAGGGGGGGAGNGSAGGDGGLTTGSAGGSSGSGALSDINGTSTAYGASRGGGSFTNTAAPADQTGNTGRGGNGGNAFSGVGTKGSNGAKGIVIIRYAGAPKATGGTITTVGSDTVHTFTASGTFTLA